MNNTAFGEVVFNYGFDVKSNLTLWGKAHNITVTAKAYREKDGITSNQEQSFQAYKEKLAETQIAIERLIAQYFEATENKPCTPEQLSARFFPRTLLFGRDGNYVLLLDDAADPDNGLAVCLSPEEKVVTQDDYL
ncbi:hypothetical protein AGMMS50256_27240 [Betaproteobacteria bacterium]|nr:hypothetical protein AGMMS50256_27240 [Betaproteobacteria bacterium]